MARSGNCRSPISGALGEEIMGEANISAQETQAHANPRLSGPHVDASGPRCDQGPPPEGPSRPDGLTWRIRDRSTFTALGAAPRRRSGALSVSYLPGSDEASPPRVAFAIGKRVGGAVVRNRVRRRLQRRSGTSGPISAPAGPT
jgi:hypothetical protein